MVCLFDRATIISWQLAPFYDPQRRPILFFFLRRRYLFSAVNSSLVFVKIVFFVISDFPYMIIVFVRGLRVKFSAVCGITVLEVFTLAEIV